MSLLFGESSIEIYRSIIENNTDAIFVLSTDGTFLEANEVITKQYGYSIEEIEGIHFNNLIVPAYLEVTKTYFAQATQGTPCEYETQVFHKNGEILHLLVKNIPLNINGEIVGIFGVAIDKTELYKTKTSLQESQKKIADLHMALDASSIVAITDEKGIIKFVNDRFCEISSYTKEELIGKDHRILNSGYHSKTFYRELWKTICNGEIWKGEFRNKAKDGTIYWVQATIVPFLNEKGKPYQYVAIRNDITEKKQAEEALRQSEEKYRLIAENMTDLVGIVDINGVVQYASPSHKMVLGYTPEDYEGKVAFEFIHPEDLASMKSKLIEMVQKKESMCIEFRQKHANGDWVWIESKITPLGYAGEKIDQIHIVSREITERKMYEEKLSYMAYHDILTGIPNRRLFQERLKQSLIEAERYNRKLAVMFLDIDNFKQINDNLGHDVGDELLIQFAQRVKGCLRESDTLARLGGDEFTVLLPEIQEENNAATIASRIISSFQKPWSIREHIFHTTSSIGIAFYPMDGKTGNELMRLADQALYEAKENGRNNYKLYSKMINFAVEEV